MRRVLAFGIVLSSAIGCSGGTASTPDEASGTQTGDLSVRRHKPPSTGGSTSTAPECRTAAQCAVPQICKQCPGGTASCATAACVNGQCETSFPACAPGTGGASGAPQCTADADCPAIGAPCKLCPDGSSACPSDTCVNGMCVASFPSCPVGTGGAGGAGGAMCKTDADCPELGIACRLCPDGSSACPSDKCVNGACVASLPQCPSGSGGCTGSGGATGSGGETASGGATGAECRSAGDCLVPQICRACPDGKASCATAECVGGKCMTSFPQCGGGTGGSGGGTGGSGGGSVGLHWFATCGDPICRVPPTVDPSGVAPCDPTKGEKAGALCNEPNAECDPGSGCGKKLICTASDPTHGGVCPI